MFLAVKFGELWWFWFFFFWGFFYDFWVSSAGYFNSSSGLNSGFSSTFGGSSGFVWVGLFSEFLYPDFFILISIGYKLWTLYFPEIVIKY